MLPKWTRSGRHGQDPFRACRTSLQNTVATAPAPFAIGEQLGINRDTLRGWVKQAQIDAGTRLGLASDDRHRLVELERENRELRRANAILKTASAFFAAELDRPSPRS